MEMIMIEGILSARMSSTSSSQLSASSDRKSAQASENAGPPDSGGNNSGGQARSRIALQLDQRSLHFSVTAWVLFNALIGILPLTPRQLQYKGHRLSLIGTTCTTGYALFAFYRLPRAGNMHVAQLFHHVASSKDFIPFIPFFVDNTLIFSDSCFGAGKWARGIVGTKSIKSMTYMEKPCTWVETNTTAANFLSSNAEILLGFLLILSLFSRQRNAMQTFMYWQLLKLMYHSPFTAGFH
uniref:Uncharacterized protein n=1 Tax=Leersia perrieri TaxID=77586 RepID=A0A0D9V3E5_9ORYZ